MQTYTVEICETDADSKNRRVTVRASCPGAAIDLAIGAAARHGYGLGDLWCRAYEGESVGLRDQPVAERDA